MTWGSYVQNGNLQAIEHLGSELNLHINCPVHYPAYNKRLFECKCNIFIPVWMVEAAEKTGDWSLVEELHNSKIQQ